ncbi:hypothetical protein D3C85_1425410 [compost metagenome]
MEYSIEAMAMWVPSASRWAEKCADRVFSTSAGIAPEAMAKRVQARMGAATSSTSYWVLAPSASTVMVLDSLTASTPSISTS